MVLKFRLAQASELTTKVCYLRKALVYMCLCIISVSVLSACGFKLRGSQALPETLDTVLINSALQYSPLTRALNERLPVYQLRGLSATQAENLTLNESATVLITLQPEDLERRLLSVFASGQVAEYEMVYSVRYQVIFPNAEPITNTVSVSREYQDDPRQILAKSRELELIMQEMRFETADRIIRLLSSQYKLARSDASNASAPEAP